MLIKPIKSMFIKVVFDKRYFFKIDKLAYANKCLKCDKYVNGGKWVFYRTQLPSNVHKYGACYKVLRLIFF